MYFIQIGPKIQTKFNIFKTLLTNLYFRFLIYHVKNVEVIYDIKKINIIISIKIN